MRPRVYVTQPIAESALGRLRDIAEVEINLDSSRILATHKLIEAAKRSDIILCLLHDVINRDVLAANPNLKAIASMTITPDRIDVTEATTRKIIVTNIPAVVTDATADIAFGHRLMRDRIVPGGVAADLNGDGIAVLLGLVAEIRRRFPALVELYDNTASLQDRTVGTGRLAPELARQYGAGGYVGRASGRVFDARRALHYPPYDILAFDVPVLREGDVNARVWIRIREVEQSLSLVDQILANLPAGAIAAELGGAGEPREAVATVEGFRGDILVWLGLDASADVITVAALVTLLPGMTLTIGMRELSTQHLQSGVANTASALVQLFGLAFGVAIGHSIATNWLGGTSGPAPTPASLGIQLAAAVLAAVVAGPEGADEDVARRAGEVFTAGEQALEHGADAADLLNRFVGDVDDGLHVGKSFTKRNEASPITQRRARVR